MNSSDINTKFSKKINTSINNKLLTILIYVDSSSNYIKAGVPVEIKSKDEFYLYFPDEIDSYSDSLKTALRLLSFGYRLIAINVHECKNYETLRIYDDSTSSWFNLDRDLNAINTEIHSDDNLAVKVNIENLKNVNDYFLLEHNINGVSSNTIIFIQNDPLKVPLRDKNYSYAYCISPDLNNEEKAKEIKKILSTENNYICEIDEDKSTLHIAYPYPFTSILTSIGCKIEYDEMFQLEYLNAIKLNQRVMDLVSLYKSDTDDLRLRILKSDGKYKIYIYKFYNGNSIFKSEYYEDNIENLKELIKYINLNSNFLNITNYVDYLIPGDYLLSNKKDKNEVTIQDYIDALSDLNKLKDEDDDLSFLINLIYEPDFESKIIQNMILSIFDDINNPTVKIMTFLNEDESYKNNFISYFSKKIFEYNSEKYSEKELFLYFLISDQLNQSHDDLSLVEDDSRKLPEYVNYSKENKTSFSFNEIYTLMNEKLFRIEDLLLISSMNYLINYSDEERTKYLMYDFIDKIDDFFLENLGYDPKITLISFEEITEDTIEVEFEYQCQTNNSIKILNLVLNKF